MEMQGRFIGDSEIGPGKEVFVIAEAGINHNGDLDTAVELVSAAADAGCQAIKFQKRNPDVSTPDSVKGVLRETPWGEMTYLDYKHRIELDKDAYLEIDRKARQVGIQWFASPWDPDSVAFLEDMDVVAYKIASASVTDLETLRQVADTNKTVILSTGMSTIEEIDAAVDVFDTNKLCLLHTNSSYPMAPEDANLSVMATLSNRYGVPVGYSGHETGLQISIAAVALGACIIERHFTLDRSMWGTDQSSSVEPSGMARLVRDIRVVRTAIGKPEKVITDSEMGPRSKLRRIT